MFGFKKVPIKQFKENLLLNYFRNFNRLVYLFIFFKVSMHFMSSQVLNQNDKLFKDICFEMKNDEEGFLVYAGYIGQNLKYNKSIYHQ